jgi:GalNAc-alpha-(1->4)-GalNAc-alpha-(1->3)-diNAcBac-PP-undecaprenol alpha-1,4-N-acetyl-D-galactosaminyltransferase
LCPNQHGDYDTGDDQFADCNIEETEIVRCTLIISSLSAGGAERVMSRMANYWAAAGWEITLLSFDDGIKPPFYPLDTRIAHRPLKIAKNSPHPIVGIWHNLVGVRILRRAIIESKPAVVISFMDKINISTLLATRGLNIPTIVSERNDPAMYFPGKMWELLRQLIYPFADCLVVQTARASSYFPAKLQDRIRIVPNPVIVPPAAPALPKQRLGDRSVIAIGRLDPQKGFDLLLQAFARIKDRQPEWILTILGEGDLRPQLAALQDELGLQDRVQLLGLVDKPHEFLQQADLFVMSSRFEGFPNALCEAMVCGLPVISTDCPNGPREIIDDGVDGILVPTEDVPALAAAMDRLMADEHQRKSLATHAAKIVQRFGLEKVMTIWETLITELVK